MLTLADGFIIGGSLALAGLIVWYRLKTWYERNNPAISTPYVDACPASEFQIAVQTNLYPQPTSVAEDAQSLRQAISSDSFCSLITTHGGSDQATLGTAAALPDVHIRAPPSTPTPLPKTRVGDHVPQCAGDAGRACNEATHPTSSGESLAEEHPGHHDRRISLSALPEEVREAVSREVRSQVTDLLRSLSSRGGNGHQTTLEVDSGFRQLRVADMPPPPEYTEG